MVTILKMLVITALVMSCLSFKPTSLDTDFLNGVWQAEYAEMEGKAASIEQVKSIYITVEGNRLLVRLDGENSTAREVSVKIDPTKTPGHIEISPVDEPAEPVLGIYELKNVTLKVCLKLSGEGQRPDKFETGPKSEQILVIFKKVK